jgi:hypothetical protein
LNAGGINNTDSLSKEIMKITRRIYPEGQTFYYKRLNKDLKQVTAKQVAIPAMFTCFRSDKEKEYN